MKTEIKDRWVKALRSGEYQRTDCALKYKGSFCCLGVLCDIVKDEVGIEWDDIYCELDGSVIQTTIKGEECYLPKAVVDYVELNDKNPNVRIGAKYICLSDANDQGASFETIASYLEEGEC